MSGVIRFTTATEVTVSQDKGEQSKPLINTLCDYLNSRTANDVVSWSQLPIRTGAMYDINLTDGTAIMARCNPANPRDSNSNERSITLVLRHVSEEEPANTHPDDGTRINAHLQINYTRGDEPKCKIRDCSQDGVDFTVVDHEENPYVIADQVSEAVDRLRPVDKEVQDRDYIFPDGYTRDNF